MKRFFTFSLSAALTFSALFPANVVSAHTEPSEVIASYDEEIVSETTQYFEDGSYLTITVNQDTPATARNAVYTQSGSKSYILRNKYDEELWRFIVYGTFSIDPGVSATCTAVSYSYTITDTYWKFDSAITSKSGNQAIGDATFILNYIVSEPNNIHVVLSCDPNGKLY